MQRILVVTMVALGALWSSALANAAGNAPVVKYELSYTGLAFVKHTESGSTQNGGCPQFPGDEAPFSNSYTIKVAWNAEFKFGFVPGASRTGASHAKLSSVHGSSFRYTGSAYDDNCNKVSYGPGGKPCTGTLRGHGKALLIARLTTARKNEDMRFDIQPFGGLVASPASCMNDAGQPVTADSVMDLGALSNSFLTKAYSTVERISHGFHTTKQLSIDRKLDCAMPGPFPGDTDTCSETATGNATVVLTPLG